MNPKTFPKPLPVTLSVLETIVDDAHTTQIMAMFEGKAAATVSLRHTKYEETPVPGVTKRYPYKVAYFYQLFVHEAVRGHGVGRQLVEECCKISALHGCTSICLNVGAKFHAVLPFYKKLGFLPAYEYPHPDATLILSRQLAEWNPPVPEMKEIPV